MQRDKTQGGTWGRDEAGRKEAKAAVVNASVRTDAIWPVSSTSETEVSPQRVDPAGSFLCDPASHKISAKGKTRWPTEGGPQRWSTKEGKFSMGIIRPTILIVDDDPAVLTGLEGLLSLYGYHVVTFVSSNAVLEYDFPAGPCCAIVNMQMPGLAGPQIQALLLRRRAGLPVIFLSDRGDVPTAVQAMKCGAADYLTKPIEEKRLLEVLGRVLKQEQQFRGEEEEKAIYQERFNSLTTREKQVCQLVVEGKLNKQIAADLGTCEKTVKVHRGRVMRKMRVGSLAHLVRVVVTLQGETPAASGGKTSATTLLKKTPQSSSGLYR